MWKTRIATGPLLGRTQIPMIRAPIFRAPRFPCCCPSRASLLIGFLAFAHAQTKGPKPPGEPNVMLVDRSERLDSPRDWKLARLKGQEALVTSFGAEHHGNLVATLLV